MWAHGERFGGEGGSPPQPPGLAEGVGCGFGGLLGFLGACGSLGSGTVGAGSYSRPAFGLGRPTSGLRAGGHLLFIFPGCSLCPFIISFAIVAAFSLVLIASGGEIPVCRAGECEMLSLL